MRACRKGQNRRAWLHREWIFAPHQHAALGERDFLANLRLIPLVAGDEGGRDVFGANITFAQCSFRRVAHVGLTKVEGEKFKAIANAPADACKQIQLSPVAEPLALEHIQVNPHRPNSAWVVRLCPSPCWPISGRRPVPTTGSLWETKIQRRVGARWVHCQNRRAVGTHFVTSRDVAYEIKGFTWLDVFHFLCAVSCWWRRH